MPLDLNASLVELTLSLCNIESVSGNEKQLADEIEAALTALPHLKVSRDGNAVIATTNQNLPSRVIIAGHIDTVPVANNLPAELHHFEREQAIVGRGTVDMKGGIAVMLKLALELDSPKHDITWIFYDNEEVASDLNGLGRISRNTPEVLSGDFAVLCEPTSALIEGGCNGTMRVELESKGVKAHSARPWMGKNAIHGLSQALATLSSFEPETITVDGLDYRESLNAVVVSGGIATNVIPDRATLTVNYRFAPSRSGAEAEQKLRALFSSYDLTVTDLAEGARPGLNLGMAQEFAATVKIPPRPKYGWTDVARFASLGIPAVNYGPGDAALAHADNENVPVGHLFDCFEGLGSWLRK
jgi:succinyl-diaminopimelate desuccinylase